MPQLAVDLQFPRARFTGPWLVASSAMLLLQVVYPMAKSDIELHAWNSALSVRPDALSSTYVLDAVLSGLGIFLGFVVSAGMYRMALNEWRGTKPRLADLAEGQFHLGTFLPMTVAAAVYEEILWAVVTRFANGYGALAAQTVLLWLSITPFMFTMPLVVDQRLRLDQAARLSARAVAKRPLASALNLLSAYLRSLFGALACLVGAVATFPCYQLVLSGLYLRNFPDSARDTQEKGLEETPPALQDPTNES